MSARRRASAAQVRRVLEEVHRLRVRGARARVGRDVDADEEPPAPPGGWKPLLDDEGRVIPDPPPREPTDWQGGPEVPPGG